MRARITTRRLPITLAAVGLTVAGLAVAGLSAGPALAGPASHGERVSSERVSSELVGTASGPAHSLASARTHAVVPRNSWQHDTLASHSQQNWYRLKLSSRSYVYTLLGDLPANYSLRLYDNTGKVLSTSDHGLLGSENVGRTLTAGTYFVRVASTSGSDARKTYALLVRVVPASATVGILTAHIGTMNDVVGDMVNVSNETLTVAFMDVSFYSSTGALLRRVSHLKTSNLLWIPMAPGSRVPFDVTMDVPQSVLEKTTRVVVVPWWSSTRSRSAVTLTVSDVHRVSHHRNGLTWIDYTGRVHNAASRAVPIAVMLAEGRDKRGVLIGIAADSQSLPSHATRTFSPTYYINSSKPTISFKGYEMVGEVP